MQEGGAGANAAAGMAQLLLRTCSISAQDAPWILPVPGGVNPAELAAGLRVVPKPSLYFCGFWIQFLSIKDEVYSEGVLAKKIIHNFPLHCESIFPLLSAL